MSGSRRNGPTGNHHGNHHMWEWPSTRPARVGSWRDSHSPGLSHGTLHRNRHARSCVVDVKLVVCGVCGVSKSREQRSTCTVACGPCAWSHGPLSDRYMTATRHTMCHSVYCVSVTLGDMLRHTVCQRVVVAVSRRNRTATDYLAPHGGRAASEGAGQACPRTCMPSL